MNFIESYKTKNILKTFSETKVLVDKLTKNWKERDSLEWQLYEKWNNHDCKLKEKGFCDICEEVCGCGLYEKFLKVAGYERELINSTKC